MRSQKPVKSTQNVKWTLATFAVGSCLLGAACSPQKSQNSSSLKAGSENAGIVAGSIVADQDPISLSTVGLVIIGPQGEGVCSGTLIAPNIVLTAAHCFLGGVTQVIAVFGKEIYKSKVMLPADRVLVHPQFESKALGQGGWNDLALIHLKGAVPATAKTVPPLKDAKLLKAGLSGVAAGFGNTDPKGVASDEGTLRKTTLVLSNPQFEGTELLFPLGLKGASTCHGDSGGPLYMKLQGQLQLVGVTSRGTGADCRNVSIFTNVAAHVDFLQKSIATLSQEASAK